jgi:hypothetical protein
MKKAFLFLLLFLFCDIAFTQQVVTWQLLSRVKWYTAYVPSMDGYCDLPRFSKEIKALDGQQISIKGFYVPVDASGKIFALSANPSNMCFFCGGGGYESVMEIIVKEGETNFKHVRTDKYIEIKGVLKLNKSDPNHLMYILKESELVTIIK